MRTVANAFETNLDEITQELQRKITRIENQGNFSDEDEIELEALEILLEEITALNGLIS